MRKKVLFVGIALIANIQLNLSTNTFSVFFQEKDIASSHLIHIFHMKCLNLQKLGSLDSGNIAGYYETIKFKVEYYHEKA